MMIVAVLLIEVPNLGLEIWDLYYKHCNCIPQSNNISIHFVGANLGEAVCTKLEPR